MPSLRRQVEGRAAVVVAHPSETVLHFPVAEKQPHTGRVSFASEAADQDGAQQRAASHTVFLCSLL